MGSAPREEGESRGHRNRRDKVRAVRSRVGSERMVRSEELSGGQGHGCVNVVARNGGIEEVLSIKGA